MRLEIKRLYIAINKMRFTVEEINIDIPIRILFPVAAIGTSIILSVLPYFNK